MRSSPARPQSAVLIPVPDAEPVVGPWRRRYDPMAPAGVPAHITLMVPWLGPSVIDDAELARLAAVVAKTGTFDFSLRGVAWFARRVLWLAPDPAGPFLDLIAGVAEEFEIPPWGGQFDEIVPHLTVAHAPEGLDLAPVAETLDNDLPISCRAEEVWVMIGDGDRWWRRAALPLRWPGPHPEPGRGGAGPRPIVEG